MIFTRGNPDNRIYDHTAPEMTAALRNEVVLQSGANALTMALLPGADGLSDTAVERISDELAMVAAYHGANPDDMVVALYREERDLAINWLATKPPDAI